LLQNSVSDGAATKARPRAKRVYGKPRSRTERARFNGRTREGVRLRMLEKQFRACLGEAADNPVTLLAVRRAAELVLLTETMRAARIRGEAVDVSHMLRMEGVAARALAALGLSSALRESEPMSLEAHLAAASAGELRPAPRPARGTAPTSRDATSEPARARETGAYGATSTKGGGRRR
jgi:hypothetical protein